MAPTRRRVKKGPTLAAKVANLSKMVKIDKPEMKYSDVNYSGQRWNWTPTSTYVSDIFAGISQGTGDVDRRLGDEINVHSLKLRMTVYNNGATPFTGRLVGIRVKHNAESLITTTNIGNMVMESAYSSTANAVNAPFDHDNSSNFVKIFDRRFVINPQTTNAVANTALGGNLFIQKTFKINKRIQFFQAAATNTHNGVYFFFLSDQADGGERFSYGVLRINYTDA
uniref:Cap protein n=1 Tax=Polar freshwater circular DNA virus TaxID=2749196 RepID=A0A7D7F0P5_9VIRU|nr:MAG: Cap protein [Polar freshwater circular DNA virus]